MTRHFFIVTASLCFSFLTVPAIPQSEMPREIRIALMKAADNVEVKVKGAYKIVNPATNGLLSGSQRLPATTISFQNEGIQVGKNYYGVKRIRFVPTKDVIIIVNGQERHYRGELDIVAQKENKLLVINRLNLEDYIKGVLYHEISHRWPMEATKAQAVAARTYAVYRIKESEKAKAEYDVTTDIYSQVYGGKTSEKYRTNLAVDRTQSEVLVFNDQILPAYFAAACGGFTENAEELWNHKGISPLNGVRCGFCRHSPHYHWKRNFQLKKMQEKLNENGYKLGLIKEIRVLEHNASGRIKTLEILTRDDQQVKISGKDFRQIIGPNEIRSNSYRIVMQGYYVDLIGKGWGHGVGLCQWGAHGMSVQRYKYKEILQRYYPGVEIITLN